MFSGCKPEKGGLSGREKKTVKGNKEQRSFAPHDDVSQKNVT